MYFNIRVYGILIQNDRVLISDEEESGMRFSKFPGGGLEFGEGLIDGLKREFQEECNLDIEVLRHLYTTDFYVKSIFNDSQVLSVYYLVRALGPLNVPIRETVFDFSELPAADGIVQAFRWRPLAELREDDVTFPADQRLVQLLKQDFHE